MDAAAAVRSARRRAGLTQVQLAERAGVAQSVISAYESGRRQPSLPMLQSLVAAAGVELRVQVAPIPRRLDALTGPVGRRVRRHRQELVERAAAHGVTGLRVFGSVARGQDGPDSDVDLLGELPTGMGLVGLGRVRDDLEAIIGRPVDLVPASALKPSVRVRVAADAVAL